MFGSLWLGIQFISLLTLIFKYGFTIRESVKMTCLEFNQIGLYKVIWFISLFSAHRKPHVVNMGKSMIQCHKIALTLFLESLVHEIH